MPFVGGGITRNRPARQPPEDPKGPRHFFITSAGALSTVELRADATFKVFVVENVKPENAAADAAAVERDEMLAELELSKSDPRTTTAPTGSVRAEVNVIALAEQSTPISCTKTASDSRGDGALEAEVQALRRISADIMRLVDCGWSLVPLYPLGAKNSAGVVSKGKSPFGHDWQLIACPDPAKTKQWFMDALNYMQRCPNVGALNGCKLPLEAGDSKKTYLCIIDGDVKGPDGEIVTTLAARRTEIEAEIGVKLPDTVEDESPSGGGHWFFWTDEDLGCSVKISFLTGWDYPIQAAVCPSVIGDKAYKWKPARSPWEKSLAKAPTELVALIKKGRAKVSPPIESFSSEYCDKWSIRRAINRFRALEDIHGQKHDSRMVAIATSLNEGVVPDYVVRIQEKHVCWADAHHADSSNEGFASQMEGIVRGRLLKGIPLGVSHPRYIAKRDALQAMEREAERAEFLESGEFNLSPEQIADASAPQPPEQRERIEKERQAKAEREAARENAERDAQSERARAKAEKAKIDPGDEGEGEKAEAKSSANPGGGVDFRDARVKRAPYVMKGWLHRGETVQWFGPPGAGKSASLLSIMLASAAAPPEGAMFAGCRVKRGLMIFAAYERAGETQDRLAAAGKRLSLPDDSPFVLLTRPPLLKDGKAAESVIEIIRHYEKLHGMPCSTFAVDTLTAARPGMGQSDDGEMSSLMNHLQHIRDTVGCCLPFIHHPTKADANNPRGSGVTTGHVDKEVVVNKGRIRMQKNNAGPDADALDLKIESVLMGEDEDGDPVSVAYANVRPGRVGVDDAFDGGKEGAGVFGSGGVPERLKLAYDALKAAASERRDGVVSTNDWFDRIDADAKEAKLKKPVRATKNNHKDALVEGDYVVSKGVGFWGVAL
jgi:hypothetical protein